MGIHSGFQGLLTKDVESFTDKSLSGLLNQGGTMLGTSREKPFKKNGVISDVNKPALIEQNIKELGLDCVVCIGGNGTQKTAAKLAAMGLNIVSVPKTIDNDIWGTDFSFGFDSAVSIATDAIDRLPPAPSALCPQTADPPRARTMRPPALHRDNPAGNCCNTSVSFSFCDPSPLQVSAA